VLPRWQRDDSRRSTVLDATLGRVRARLLELAELGGEDAAEVGRRLVDAVDDSLQLALLDLLATVAAEVNGQLDGLRVEVRGSSDPEVVVVADERGGPAPSADDLSARLTLRLPPALKDRITAAADREGVSVNAWVVRVLDRAGERSGPRGVGRQLRGYASS
jgi:hypothetical protein